VQKYLRDIDQQALRALGAPIPVRLPDNDDDEETGFFSSKAREYVGALLFLARGTRPDISCAVAKLARHTSRWTKRDDRFLEHLMKYLHGTIDRGLVYRIHPSDRDELWVRLMSDADHAGSEDSAKSTSGWLTFVNAAKTSCLIGWGSKLQGATATSTPSAEVQAASDATCKSGAPIWAFWEAVLKREVRFKLQIDNTAGEIALGTGWSKGMRLLR
jgi:hypothetical protein